MSREKSVQEAAFAVSLGTRIVLLRGKRALSQHKLATATGYQRETIRRWEKGHAAMDVIALSRIAQALNISPVDLLGDWKW